MKKRKIGLWLLVLLLLVGIMSSCNTGQRKIDPPPVPAGPGSVTGADDTSNSVALYFDNTRNTRGYVFGVQGSNFVKTVDSIYETMLGWQSHAFYALTDKLAWESFDKTLENRKWKGNTPANLKNAYKNEAFYEFIAYAEGKGPIQRLVGTKDVDRDILNIYVTDLIEQDNQTRTLADWLTKAMFSEDKELSITVFRIESKYNGSVSIPEEGTVSVDGNELQMIKKDTKSLSFFCILQGPTQDLRRFSGQLATALKQSNVEFQRCDIVSHGGIERVELSEVVAGQLLSRNAAKLITEQFSNDTVYLQSLAPAEFFVNAENAELPRFCFKLERGRKTACLNLYVPLPDIPAPDGSGNLTYAFESDNDSGGADILLSIPNGETEYLRGASAKIQNGKEKPQQVFQWSPMDDALARRFVKISMPQIPAKGQTTSKKLKEDVPRFDSERMDRRTAQTIGRDKNIAGTFAYLVKTESGALQIKLIFNDLDALRSGNAGQPQTEAIAIRLPVMAKYTKQAIGADIFKETAFRSFGDTLQGRSGGPSVEQQWNDFWTRELVNLTICIQL